MQAALSAVIALLSLSLVSCLLDKETFEHNFQGKGLKGVISAYMALAVLLLVLALIALPHTAQTESFSDAGAGTQAVYGCSVIIAVGGFALQAISRYQIMQKSRNQKTRAKEDNNTPLDGSANHSVGSSEDSQQQALDTAPQAKPRSVSTPRKAQKTLTKSNNPHRKPHT